MSRTPHVTTILSRPCSRYDAYSHLMPSTNKCFYHICNFIHIVGCPCDTLSVLRTPRFLGIFLNKGHIDHSTIDRPRIFRASAPPSPRRVSYTSTAPKEPHRPQPSPTPYTLRCIPRPKVVENVHTSARIPKSSTEATRALSDCPRNNSSRLHDRLAARGERRHP